MRSFVAVVLLPATVYAVSAFVAGAIYGSLVDAPSPVVVVVYYAIPALWLPYAAGYAATRFLRRFVSVRSCFLFLVAILLVCLWRIPAFSHGVNGSDHPRLSHVLLWVSLLVVPSIGGIVALLPGIPGWDEMTGGARLGERST